MFSAGTEKIFTGDGGTLAYLFLVTLVSLIYVGRAAAFRDAGDRRRFPWICIGFFLLVASRVLNASPIVGGNSGLSLASSALMAVGLYFVFIAIFSRSESVFPGSSSVSVLLAGGVTGAILGGGAFAILSGDVPGRAFITLLCFFSAFAPAGFLLGCVLKGRGRYGGSDFLAFTAGVFLVFSTLLRILSGLGFSEMGVFWLQLFAMIDIAGFFLFLAAAVIGRSAPGYVSGHVAEFRGNERESEEGSRDGREEYLSFSRATGINMKISRDCRGHVIYGNVVEAISKEAAADYVVLRIKNPGNGNYEVKAFAGKEGIEAESASNLSVTQEALDRLCRDDCASANGYILTWNRLGGDREDIVPGCIEWEGKSIHLAPILESGSMLGFFTVGFFEKPPPQRFFIVLDLYSSQVVQVIQKEQYKENIRERERALSACKEDLESVNHLKSNFLSIVSHELRTPLTSVKAYTETLLDNVGSIERDTIQDFLRVMNDENERLIKLVDNILNYSCMETGLLKVEKTSCNINEMIDDVHNGLQKKFLENGVNVELRVPRHTVVIDADNELIHQLLQNLMNNAVKFTPPAGKVVVTLEEEASAARIIVQDTGKGIPEDQLEKIFERFHQVDTSNTREHGGSGLGLAICKNIVDWHDGQIWVENVKEAGAKFVVLLPMNDIVVRQAASSGFIGSVRFERERYLMLLVEMLSEFLQARKASIMLLDEEQQILRIVAAKGLDPEFVQNTRLEVGERIAGRVFQQGESLHVFDIEKDLDFGRANNSMFYGTHSFISFPLRDANKVIGVLNVSDHVEGREFTGADKELLEALGGIIVGMLKKLNAYEKVSSNFENLKDSMRGILDIRETWGSRNLSNLTLLALAIGKRLVLDEKSLTALRLGMNLYDLGMMKVPRNIRSKKEKLTDAEWKKLREHPDIGYTFVSLMGLEERIMRIVRSHHEYYDGSGYPDGLLGREIPIEARIVNVIDSFRALITQGPYRRCYSMDEARNEIIKGAATKFDPRVVGAFVKALHELGAVEGTGELTLAAVERKREKERKDRSQEREKGGKDQRETVKEGIP